MSPYWHTSFLMLGSNLGNKLQNLTDAVQLIDSRCGKTVSYSEVFASAPWGYEDEHDYLNQAIKLETNLDAHELLDCVLAIENELGRVRTQTATYEARTIDIDLLYFDQKIIDTAKLCIPHPHIAARRFVLEPLCQIASDYLHPILNKTNAELLLSCTDQSEVYTKAKE